MSSSLRVRPADGHECRHPYRPFPLLQRQGENVPDSPYWRKQIVSGAVVLCAPPADPKPAKPVKE